MLWVDLNICEKHFDSNPKFKTPKLMNLILILAIRYLRNLSHLKFLRRSTFYIWKMSYTELHTTTNFSFLRGASHPEELIDQAASLGYASIAVTDRNTFAGLVRAHSAAKKNQDTTYSRMQAWSHWWPIAIGIPDRSAFVFAVVEPAHAWESQDRKRTMPSVSIGCL